jgi:hypothetical protein
MQLAAPGADVHVTAMRQIRAAGGLARRSGLGPDSGSHPGADKHTAAGGRVALAARGALGCGWLCELALALLAGERDTTFGAQDGWVDGVRGGLRLS